MTRYLVELNSFFIEAESEADAEAQVLEGIGSGDLEPGVGDVLEWAEDEPDVDA